MKLEINPSSGYDNSYYDIRFIVTFHDKPLSDFRFSIFNKTAKTRLNVLAASQGYIDSDGYVHSKPCKEIEGYFNLFNDDKMNTRLQDFMRIELECVIETNEGKLTENIFFYNESFSTDKAIVPFQIILDKDEIDLSQNQPLQFNVIADSERSFHLTLEATATKVSYDFYIFTKKGNILLEIPVEILHHELNLYKIKNKQFCFCYMKRHGVNYSNVINEKKVIITGTEFHFVNDFRLEPQTRFDPVGQELNYEDFLPSDRYFVPTWKNHTFYLRHRIDPERAFHNRVFKDEIVYLRKKSKKRLRDLPVTGERFWRGEEERPIKTQKEEGKDFYTVMSKMYNEQAVKLTPVAQRLKTSASTASLGKLNAKRESGCVDCGRKKRK